MTVLTQDVLPAEVLDHLSALYSGATAGSAEYEAERQRLRESRAGAASSRLRDAGVPTIGGAPSLREALAGRLDPARTHKRLREAGILVAEEVNDGLDELDGPQLAAALHAEIVAGANDTSPVPVRLPVEADGSASPDAVTDLIATAREFATEEAARRAEFHGLTREPSAAMVESARKLRESTRRAKGGDRR